MIAPPPRILIVESRYYPKIADLLLDGALEAMRVAKFEFEVVSLPGVLELAPAIAIADDSNRRPVGPRYDGYVALGCVMRDDVLGAGQLAETATQGLMTVAIDRRLALGQGLITVETETDGLRWAKEADGGGAAARACIDLIALKQRLFGA